MRRVRKAVRVSVGVTAAALLAPAAVEAKIVIGQGAAGLKLGDPGGKVQRVLGEPERVTKYEGGESWFFDGYWITVTTKHRVKGIEINNDREQRTAKGIGLGSSLRALKKAYPAVTCTTNVILEAPVCHLPTRQSGRSVPTNFVCNGSGRKAISIIDIGAVGEFG